MIFELLTSGLLVLGALTMLIAAVGLIRLPDVYSRLSASSKAAPSGAALLLIGGEMFTEEMPRLDESEYLPFVFYAFGCTQITGVFWYMGCLWKSVGEAHGVSTWVGFATTFLSGVVLVVGCGCLATILLPFVVARAGGG